MGSFDCMQGHFCLLCGVAWGTLSLRLFPSHFVSLRTRLGFGQGVPTARREQQGHHSLRDGNTMAGREGPAPRYLSKESRRQPGSAKSPVIRDVHSNEVGLRSR